MDTQLHDQIVSIIDDVNDMTIATVREDGFPHATTVSYINEGLTIYFMTSATLLSEPEQLRANGETMKETFKDKSVIITGASSGIGKQLALQLADEGAWLAFAARNAERLEKLAAECIRRGGKAIAVATDVANESQCRTLIQRTEEAYGRIDVLVNNAGIDVVSKFEDLHDLQLFKQVVDVNFYGAVHCTYYAVPHLKKSHGKIVNISSVAGVLAIPFNTAYVASKFALTGFSDALRMELKRDGVSVTVICPSLVVTEFHQRYMEADGQPIGPSGRAIYTPHTMTADKCAQIILRAARSRKRQIVMRHRRMLLWLKLIAPGWVDRLIISKFRQAAQRRTEEEKNVDRTANPRDA